MVLARPACGVGSLTRNAAAHTTRAMLVANAKSRMVRGFVVVRVSLKLGNRRGREKIFCRHARGVPPILKTCVVASSRCPVRRLMYLRRCQNAQFFLTEQFRHAPDNSGKPQAIFPRPRDRQAQRSLDVPACVSKAFGRHAVVANHVHLKNARDLHILARLASRIACASDQSLLLGIEEDEAKASRRDAARRICFASPRRSEEPQRRRCRHRPSLAHRGIWGRIARRSLPLRSNPSEQSRGRTHRSCPEARR